MKCQLCNKEIHKDRGGKFAKHTVKYCSNLCNKRASYLRLTKTKHSTLLEGPNFNFCTSKGLYWELWVAKHFNGKCLSSETMNQKTDVIINNKNIDVKASNIYKRKFKRGSPVVREQKGCWAFNRGKAKKEIDYFMCLCLVDNELIKIYKIPNKLFGKSGVVIGHKSKFDKYKQQILID